jgi:hypothetical protein
LFFIVDDPIEGKNGSDRKEFDEKSASSAAAGIASALSGTSTNRPATTTATGSDTKQRIITAGDDDGDDAAIDGDEDVTLLEDGDLLVVGASSTSSGSSGIGTGAPSKVSGGSGARGTVAAGSGRNILSSPGGTTISSSSSLDDIAAEIDPRDGQPLPAVSFYRELERFMGANLSKLAGMLSDQTARLGGYVAIICFHIN